MPGNAANASLPDLAPPMLSSYDLRTLASCSSQRFQVACYRRICGSALASTVSAAWPGTPHPYQPDLNRAENVGPSSMFAEAVVGVDSTVHQDGNPIRSCRRSRWTGLVVRILGHDHDGCLAIFIVMQLYRPVRHEFRDPCRKMLAASCAEGFGAVGGSWCRRFSICSMRIDVSSKAANRSLAADQYTFL